MKPLIRLATLSAALSLCAAAHAQERATLPILVPLTGALALEGQSQRDGALLAFAEREAQQKVELTRAIFAHPVLDTASNPQIAVQAFERTIRELPKPRAMMGPIDGNSMLALLPLAEREQIALVAVSGTARLTELGNRQIFRFFPSDAVVKEAQARYIVQELRRKKVALIYQNTAYGQSGNEQLGRSFEQLGAQIVYRNSVPVTTKELSGVIAQVRESGADVVALQLHSGSSALFVGQAARAGLNLPIVGGSALHQPSTAALLEPGELKGVCAETASAPAADTSPEIAAFARSFRTRFAREPDAFALAAYDAVRAVLQTWERDKPVAEMLARGPIKGLAMSYQWDGRGNMAHNAIIVCYDGTSRTPHIVARYSFARRVIRSQ
jgi:branched-chain amino acid transport system substrate-binding protein